MNGEQLRVRGVVVRMLIDPEHGTFQLEYRTRDLSALLAEAEWGWARDKDQAYVFESFSPPLLPGTDAAVWSAEAHAAALKIAGEQHVHAAVFERGCAQARAERRAGRDATLEHKIDAAGLRVSPQDSYDRTRRYLGERD